MEGSVIKSLLMWFYGDRIRDDIDDVTKTD